MTTNNARRIHIKSDYRMMGPCRVDLCDPENGDRLAQVVTVEIPEVGPGDTLTAKLTVFADIDLDLNLDDVEITERCRACGQDLPREDTDG